jgi:phage shock protein PspC (stress-responsive transcriptional regulator)
LIVLLSKFVSLTGRFVAYFSILLFIPPSPKEEKEK